MRNYNDKYLVSFHYNRYHLKKIFNTYFPIALIDSVHKISENYDPQALLEECKYAKNK